MTHFDTPCIERGVDECTKFATYTGIRTRCERVNGNDNDDNNINDNDANDDDVDIADAATTTDDDEDDDDSRTRKKRITRKNFRLALSSSSVCDKVQVFITPSL